VYEILADQVSSNEIKDLRYANQYQII